MKNTTFKILVGTTLLAVPLFVGAHDTGIPHEESTSTKAIMPERPEAIKNKIEDRMEVRKDKIEDLRAKASSTREKIEDRVDNRRDTLREIAKNRFEKMVKRFEMTIQREKNIMNRIMSRVEKVKSEGGQTSEAEKYLSEAKLNFDEATTALNLLKNATSSPDVLVDASTATSTKVRTALEKLKNMAKEVEKNIREGHQALTQAVKALRGSSSTNSN